MTYMLLAWCLYPWAQLSNISKCSYSLLIPSSYRIRLISKLHALMIGGYSSFEWLTPLNRITLLDWFNSLFPIETQNSIGKHVPYQLTSINMYEHPLTSIMGVSEVSKNRLYGYTCQVAFSWGKWQSSIGIDNIFRQSLTWRFPIHGGTPKSSTWLGFPMINHPFWVPIYGNHHIFMFCFWNHQQTSCCLIAAHSRHAAEWKPGRGETVRFESQGLVDIIGI